MQGSDFLKLAFIIVFVVAGGLIITSLIAKLFARKKQNKDDQQ